eukprot:TRINITY_DN633_c5_g1_i1.p1 TRINITY_DN633_c5_g1~~TRINITY_DN633_c5_g1_i1.p1  ORF type:complete len:508 (+),score=109.72 TRINITY_DN633_c5_g1_i1:70-1524(+)
MDSTGTDNWGYSAPAHFHHQQQHQHQHYRQPHYRHQVQNERGHPHHGVPVNRHQQQHQHHGTVEQLSPMVLKGADGTTVPIPWKIKVKDPAVRGNILYDTPSSKIEPTYGLWEYLDSQQRGGAHKLQCHRATLCKLYLEDRCGQGSKCKSFHVDKHFVQESRSSMNVEFDNSFLTEVAVLTPGGIVASIRYKAIGRTKGLDAYKAMLPTVKIVPPATLCPLYCRGFVCEAERNCEHIHIKQCDVKESIRRTPCCYRHGDSTMQNRITDNNPVEVRSKTGSSWSLPLHCIALTTGWVRRVSTVVASTDLCAMHVKSRCKFGRGCDRIHVCRQWASESGVLSSLSNRVATNRPSSGYEPQNPSILVPTTSQLSPSSGTPISYPPSPSGFSLVSLSSEVETTPQNYHLPLYAPTIRTPIVKTPSEDSESAPAPSTLCSTVSNNSRRLSAFPVFECDDDLDASFVSAPCPEEEDIIFNAVQLITEDDE